MSLVGADTRSLRRLAGDFARQADQLRLVVRAVDQLVEPATWLGPDARDFQGRWRHDAARRVTAVAENLDEMSRVLIRNAEEQDRTSATLGAGASAGALLGAAAAAVTGLDDGVRDAVRQAARRVDDEVFQRNTQTSRRQSHGEKQGEAVPDGSGFEAVPPTKPNITWDEGYEYGTESPSVGDYLTRAKWQTLAEGVRGLMGMDDAADMYQHYASNTGTDVHYDLGEAYREDDGMRASVNWEMANAAAAADRMATDRACVSITGPAHLNKVCPTTENWQKAVGGHQQWSSATATREGDTITMTVTVHAEDHYNFNPGQADIASGTQDSENGRLTTVGLAKPFDSQGTYTRTVMWKAGSPPTEGQF